MGMYYFKDADSAWHRCSDTGVDTVANYIWANMTRDELSGSPVAVGGIAAPAPGGGGGGGGIPLEITNVIVSNITENSADISWDTNKPSNSQVEYWASPRMTTPLDQAMVTSHLIHLTGLTSDTTYHFIAKSWDASGMLALSDEYTFTTRKAPVAAFACSNLSISPGEVNIGEAVTISVMVANTGTAFGTYKVTLKINGVVEETKDITLNAGASEKVTFTMVKDVAGTYSVEVDGLKGSFTVKEKPTPPAPPPPGPLPPVKAPIKWPLVWGIIGGIVVVAIIIFLVVRRRGA